MRTRNVLPILVLFLLPLPRHVPDASGAEGEQVIRQLRYPEYDERGMLKFELLGEEATIRPDGLIAITNLDLSFYEDGEVLMRVTSPACLFDRENNAAVSTSTVVISRAEIVLTGRGFVWNGETGGFSIHDEAKVVLKTGAIASGEAENP